ncbi:hypothetical protein [Paracoccus alkanivorans]|uniref:hypothetical protein n=1 Tax=Paracoccus alkanivorans TaxID=2116655 RepID=UPI00140CEED0|nr:hypothetical protein [Paracoccus alkanivorans]
MERERPFPQETGTVTGESLSERVRKVQEFAKILGFGPSDNPEADKAFMDEQWGED